MAHTCNHLENVVLGLNDAIIGGEIWKLCSQTPKYQWMSKDAVCADQHQSHYTEIFCGAMCAPELLARSSWNHN
jgi:hypothetical protein